MITRREARLLKIAVFSLTLRDLLEEEIKARAGEPLNIEYYEGKLKVLNNYMNSCEEITDRDFGSGVAVHQLVELSSFTEKLFDVALASDYLKEHEKIEFSDRMNYLLSKFKIKPLK